MKYINVKNMSLPALGFGTYDLTGRACTQMVRHALDIGYRHIDTAQMYGNETEVGAAIRQSGVARDDIFLTTKIWPDHLGYAEFKQATAESLKKLATDYVDLLLIHWPNSSIPLEQTLQALTEVQAEGKARHIGVSNFNVALLRATVEDYSAEIVCNQVEYHPFLSQKPVLDYLHSHAMALTAYCPLARGAVMRDATLTDIGRKYNKTAAQVALRWFMEQDAVAAIPKAAKRDHCLTNFEIFDFSLSAEDMAAIARNTSNRRLVNPGWSPAWDNA